MPLRTNACAICRKKRIKCDATQPECLMCIRFGRKCPGPIAGPVFIDMTSSAATKARRHKKGTRNANDSDSRPGCWTDPTRSLLPRKLASGMLVQISQRNTLNEAFFGNFLLYFTSTGEEKDLQNRFTWLHRLPTLSTDGTNDALALALQATASAYCGVETSNIALIQHACDLYGQALHSHSHLLRSKKDITIHMVSTSVLLSIFEAMQATTADAYRAHISGAAKMMEVTGPGECMEGVLCQLFFHIRTQMAFVHLTTGNVKENRISMKKILVESLSYRRFPVFQRLMGEVARLAEMYVGTEEEDRTQVEPRLGMEEYMEVKTEVDALWFEYREDAQKKGERLFWKPELEKEEPGNTQYRDAFTALCVAYFASARVLLSLLAPSVAASYLDFTDHYQVILNAAAFLHTRDIGCAYMRMAAPLYLVALHSSKADQRRTAVAYFEDWRRGSMGGISALALQRIYKNDRTALASNPLRKT